ncbi:hypothetical protein ACGFI3_35015 [Nonomuraea wenchangensis]|uniref:hypothetical protein n=1 Tax=Nonomuraea wenchangensis TaxID=568860 RepID=UPI00371053A7
MRATFLGPSLIAAIAVVSACTSSPPPDTSPLGEVTAGPQECGLISKQAIIRATGVEEYETSGSEPGKPFSYCIVTDPQDEERGFLLSVKLDNPSALSLEELQNTMKHDRGVDLPPDLGPGYTAEFESKNGPSTYAYAWTPDTRRLLSVWITPGAPGRDHRADAVEFVRQLKPILLSPSK